MSLSSHKLVTFSSISGMTTRIAREVIDLLDSGSEGSGQVAVVSPSVPNSNRQVLEVRLDCEGQPQALPRPRFWRGGVFNLQQGRCREFQRASANQLRSLGLRGDALPVFGRGIPLVLEVWFFLRRPQHDFVGGRRVLGNLRPTAAQEVLPPIVPDADNLAKFVLDALNEVVCQDDKQVVGLICHKLRDNLGLCNGRTVVHVSQCHSAELP